MKPGAPTGRTSSAGGGRGADALSGARASGRHTHRKRPIFRQGPERANHRGRENRRRDTSGIRRDVVKPPGSRKGVCRSSSRNAGSAVDRWGSTGRVRAEVEGAEWQRGVGTVALV